MSKGKVVVGMSGGVDSAVAAYLLQEEGYDVVGVTIRSWEGEENRCCEIDDARNTAFKLSFPFYPWNAVMNFREKVVEPFINDYLQGKTPNPCVLCNRYVKWETLSYIAKIKQADWIATGHYARIEKLNDRYAVGIGKDKSKDQSYMLYTLTQEDLSKTLFPLANLTKSEVREIAKDIGLSVAEKSDSQEICFVTDGNYTDFLERERKEDIPKSGNFIDTKGNILGKHKGIIHYTVGQRKGLGLALGYPAYVKKIRADKNEVVVGNEEEIYNKTIICECVNFMGVAPLNKGDEIRAKVKIRYHHSGENAKIESLGDKIKITFENRVKAAAPGQSAVFYNDDGLVLGGGIIAEVYE